jgi:hypothetical protein
VSRAKGNDKPPGDGGRSKKSSVDDPTPVRFPPSVSEKKSSLPKSQDGIAFAVTDFLAGLRLSGSERVLGSLAIALAEGMDASPAYAKGKLAHELREVLTELAKAELSPENLTLLAGIEQ